MKFSYSDILLKKHKLQVSHLFCCNHTCYCFNMVSVTSASHYITSASRYHLGYQCRSSMYIHGLIPGNFAEFAEAVPIGVPSEVTYHPDYELRLIRVFVCALWVAEEPRVIYGKTPYSDENGFCSI